YFFPTHPPTLADYTLSLHDALPISQRGVQKARPSVMDWEADLRKMTIPTLIIVGDSDDPCIEPNVFLKRTIPSSQLCVFPNSGRSEEHTSELQSRVDLVCRLLLEKK